MVNLPKYNSIITQGYLVCYSDMSHHEKACFRVFDLVRPKLAHSATVNEALPGVLGNPGKGAFISGEQGNKGNFFRGTFILGQSLRGTKTILGNREHKKTNFQFLGNRGTSQFISGEQRNRYPPPLPGRVL